MHEKKTRAKREKETTKEKRELTPKQAAFVREYLIDLNATQAAIRAGYSEKTAQEQSARLLSNVIISAEVNRLKQKREAKTEITAEWVLTTIRDTIVRCQQGEPVLDAEGLPTGEWKFDSKGVLKGCELLGKHLSIFDKKDKVVDAANGGVLVINAAPGDMATWQSAFGELAKGNLGRSSGD